jgi:hypothetical protein
MARGIDDGVVLRGGEELLQNASSVG